MKNPLKRQHREVTWLARIHLHKENELKRAEQAKADAEKMKQFIADRERKIEEERKLMEQDKVLWDDPA
jgi:hypothetical protein